MTDDPKRIWLEPSCVPGGERCWSEDHPGDCCEEGCEMPAIEYIRADLVPQPPQEVAEAVERAAVRVKPLEWGGRNGYFKGEGADGSRYDVCEIGPGNWLCDKRSGGRSKILGARDSMEASQALAQADFEARILSALTAPA